MYVDLQEYHPPTSYQTPNFTRCEVITELVRLTPYSKKELEQMSNDTLYGYIDELHNV